jgi:hypothetical protein
MESLVRGGTIAAEGTAGPGGTVPTAPSDVHPLWLWGRLEYLTQLRYLHPDPPSFWLYLKRNFSGKSEFFNPKHKYT